MTKKRFPGFMLCLLLLPLAAAGAQEKRFSLSAAPGVGMNTIEAVAFGGWLGFEYQFLPEFSAGLETGIWHNLDIISTFEASAFGRWYFIKTRGGEGFVHAALGTSVIFEDGVFPVVRGAAGGGWRFPFGNWFLEPSIRLGYPFIWNLGFAGGLKL
jgi:hypothetical protein